MPRKTSKSKSAAKKKPAKKNSAQREESLLHASIDRLVKALETRLAAPRPETTQPKTPRERIEHLLAHLA